MVFIKNDLACHRRSNLELDSKLEMLSCEVTVGKEKWLISGLYKPPDVVNEVFSASFALLVDLMFAESNNIVLIGDLNFDMSKENALTNQLNCFSLTNLVKTPTCFKGETPTILDVILVPRAKCFNSYFNFECGSSDFHNIIGVSTKKYINCVKPSTIIYRSYKHFSEEAFKHDIKLIPIDVCKVFDDIDDQLWAYESLLNSIINEHAPLKKRTIKRESKPPS
jgi:hypothetical protein